MNHDAPQPSFELPAPLEGGSEVNTAPFEQAPSRPEFAPPPPLAAPSSPAPDPIQPPIFQPPAAQSSAQQSNQTSSSSSPASADDQDLIEKEWVVKAKQIVAATRDDPHAQSRELGKFKADYLKKRYNKVIKTDES